ncbi:hypothetical protein [Deinococcus budaensis]|uniref:Uncharacterized protein n=1 Tax=Deinococcus budaensis TaxID=1665626 RepID=A0A7W8GGQ9_9DEIO|nr:hypothetical protein [Deinococcus budaensis]MBB5235347.1 hypothetical protein [Deinococcus budaensis]
MTRALLLACLTLGLAGAASSPRMSDPPRPPLSRPSAHTPAQLGQARPTLDLLVTLRLLADLLERGTFAPATGARAELREMLGDLAARPTLGPLAAGRALEGVRAALTVSQRGMLDRARTSLEERADLLLARARFAAPDGPPNHALNRYGFMVPGGLALARRVAAAPDLNPYAEAGVNAQLLRRLLAKLTP